MTKRSESAFPDDPRNHWCEAKGCEEFGSYGHKIKGIYHWLCKAHEMKYRERQAAAIEKEKNRPPVAKDTPKQGTLF